MGWCAGFPGLRWLDLHLIRVAEGFTVLEAMSWKSEAGGIDFAKCIWPITMRESVGKMQKRK